MDPTTGTGAHRAVPAVRPGRAVLVAAASLAAAAGAHHAAGGAVPRPGVLAALGALAAVVALPVSGRRTSRLAVLVPAGALAQVLLHQALTVLTSAPLGTTPTAGAPAHHPATTALPPGAVASALHHDPRMLLAHAAAALATAVVLVATDRAGAAARAWLSWALPLLAGPPAARVPARPARPVPPPVLLPVVTVLGGVAPRRGPPAGVRAGR
ncbi:hypothetical protein ACFUMH_00730 [Cellulomonas sp. NPDC057328]|uniref:hypothetical protein n=1 Tax=Cellulomonas sp. NPDC057328 TaxID=3346101 RepID=UPI003645BEB4